MVNEFIQRLRQIHGSWYEWKLDKKKRIGIICKVARHKVIIVGTPEHGNLGDNAIVLGMYAFLEDCGIQREKIYEITYSEYDLINSDLSRFSWRNKLVLGVGGGNFGDLWYNEQELREGFIRIFRRCPIVVFPQTVFYSDDTVADSMKNIVRETPNITLCAREDTSFGLMKRLFEQDGAKVLNVPDIVLYMTKEKFGITEDLKRETVLLCMRKDKEKSINDLVVGRLEQILQESNVKFRYSDTVVETRTNRENRKAVVQEKLREFASARLVITDRLHGMVFAAVMGTPCLVFGNNHHKVEGTYHWIENLPYIRFANGQTRLEEQVCDLLSMNQQVYVRNKLLPYYNELKDTIQKLS